MSSNATLKRHRENLEQEEMLKRRREELLFKATIDHLKETLPDAVKRGRLGTATLVYGTGSDGRLELEAIRFANDLAPKTIEEALKDGTFRRFGIWGMC